MANRTVKVILEGQVSGYQAAMKTAQKSAQDFKGQFDDAIKNKPQEVQQVTSTVGVLGAALLATATVGVKKFMDFDQAMSGVASTGEDARKSSGALREAALEAGADTAFSATERRTFLAAHSLDLSTLQPLVVLALRVLRRLRLLL